MSEAELKKAVEESLKMSEADLKKTLPSLMDGVKSFGVGKLMNSVPNLVPRLMTKLKEIDVGKFVAEAPEASNKFMDVLWEGVSILADKNAEVKQKIVNAGEITVNFEATNSPLKGHIKLSGGKISGGSTPLDTSDLKISSDTKTLISLLTGDIDPVRGYMSGQYKMEGSLAVGIKLAPVMTSMAKLFKA